MLLDGFDLIGHSKVNGSLNLIKDKYRIDYEPKVISPLTPNFVDVYWSEDGQLPYKSVKFNCLEKAIKFVNDELEKSKK